MPADSFAEVWATRRPDSGSDTLVRLAEGSGTPIFCFHTENGGTGELREIADSFRDNRPLYSTEAIGIHDRSTPPATVTETVTRHLRDIRRVQPTGPYLLLGLGAGGRLAHEAARQLHADGEHTAVLVMVDTSAPGTPDLSRHRDLRDLYVFRLDVLSRVFGTRDAVDLIAEMAAVGWTDSETDPTSFHWRQVIWAAARLADAEHVPARYPGTATLIQSSAASREAGWHPLVGQLRTRTVTNEGLRGILHDRRTLEGLRRVFALTGAEPGSEDWGVVPFSGVPSIGMVGRLDWPDGTDRGARLAWASRADRWDRFIRAEWVRSAFPIGAAGQWGPRVREALGGGVGRGMNGGWRGRRC